jgi:hypothetical protein
MSLVQVIYISTALHELSEVEIKAILDSAIYHNKPQNVTGLLLYSRGSFMQALEGDAAAVDETMARIRLDPRHRGITVLSQSWVGEREFGTWSMGFRGVSAKDAATWPDYAPFFETGFNAETIGAKPGRGLAILRAMAGKI